MAKIMSFVSFLSCFHLLIFKLTTKTSNGKTLVIMLHQAYLIHYADMQFYGKCQPLFKRGGLPRLGFEKDGCKYKESYPHLLILKQTCLEVLATYRTWRSHSRLKF